jgi:hypothetical protein
MSLRYKFKTAGNIVSGLRPAERITLGNICGEIQTAENRLLKAAQKILDDCGRRCRGLCCCNIHIDDIMTLLDCVHIMATAPATAPLIDEALVKEGLYSADCIFLKKGTGPCIFPSDSRPEKCIVSFCRGDEQVAAEIRQVRRSFNRLARFIYVQRLRAAMRFVFSSGGPSKAADSR